MDAVIKEVDRAIIDLGFRGVQITTNIRISRRFTRIEPLFEE